MAVRAGVNAGATRFVLDLTGPIQFSVFTLDQPNRVVIDMSQVAWRLPADRHNLDTGLIREFRYGLFEPGRSRIVIDTGGPVRVRDAFLLAPTASFGYRFVLDIAGRQAGQDQAPAVQSADAGQATSAAAWNGPPLPAEKPSPTKPVVVIDPGHGGIDPGTIAADGVFEKNVTLAAARILKQELEATGRYHVVLTRDSDVFVKLGERVTIARQHGADLFISLHCDSISNHSIRGAGIYTLSEHASDEEAAMLAKKENKADLIAGVDLVNVSYDPQTTNILIDLAQRETKNASTDFANLLTHDLSGTVDLRSNAHRFAGFRVLKDPGVPSVLLEMGYLSNRRDERDLLSPAYMHRYMAAVTEAINGYFDQRGH